jgi:hypothetical protein
MPILPIPCVHVAPKQLPRSRDRASPWWTALGLAILLSGCARQPPSPPPRHPVPCPGGHCA